MTSWMMYWLMMLDNIRGATAALTAVSAIVTFFGVCFFAVARISNSEKDKEDNRKILEWLKWPLRTAWLFTITFTLGCIFIPTTKQMAAIIVVPKIINNKQVQEIPEKLMGLCDAWIKEKTDELGTGE